MKGIGNTITLMVLALFFVCFNPENGNGQKAGAALIKPVKTTKKVGKPNPDEQQFRALLKKFKESLAKKNLNNMASMMHFPFYTSSKMQDVGLGAAEDPINATEFAKYKSNIYHADVLRLLPKAGEDDLSEIDQKTDEIYYKSLQKLTDQGSRLYEVYLQYPEKGNHTESFFAFVFGKINGNYSAVATYGKWPIK